MLYALIKNNIVENVIVAEQNFVDLISSEWDHVEMLDTLHEQNIGVGIGWNYINNTFIPPSVPVTNEPSSDTRITRLAFLSRFTDAEAVAIDLASIGSTVQAASMRRYLSKVNAANFIDLSRPDTRSGVLALETAGILSQGRALEILDNPIQPEEIPV